MYERKQLFDFMLQRVKEVASEHGDQLPQAFGRWFANLYIENVRDIYVTDGTRDGKVDLFAHVPTDGTNEFHILNTKFTEKYNESAPVSFYGEITRYWQAFANKANRPAYLRTVRSELHSRYKKLFDRYDEGNARLMFVTNHRRNDRQFEAVKSYGVTIFHLEEILQFMVDFIEGAMPRTKPLVLTGIKTLLTADPKDTAVPTSIVFARVIDLIDYMQRDIYGLLFARNVRLDLGNTPVNKDIQKTFVEAPEEFAFSNNGITMLCENLTHQPAAQELTIENPRVVNGSQTLHSVQRVASPPKTARIMVRIIKIHPTTTNDLPGQIEARKAVIHKISIRSNLQNPIKKWNLVSNDDFQQELARYFHKKGLFYERREKEWKQRRTELKNLKIERGATLKSLMQLVGSFYWSKKQLGPAVAKASLGSLFDDDSYSIIRKTDLEVVYQIYLVNKILQHCFNLISQTKRYVANLKGYSNLSLFSLCVRTLESVERDWGKPQLTAVLEKHAEETPTAWRHLTKVAIDHIWHEYKRAALAYRRSQEKELTLLNYFKSQRYMGKLLHGPVPRGGSLHARRALR
jgi:hypothetical protein